MSRWLNIGLAVWTLTGVALLFGEPAAHSWWSPVWILLFLISAYAGLAARFGLGPARVTAGAIIVGFAILLALGAATGWPTGPVRFTENSGPRIAGLLPALLPIFAFALLTTAHHACSVWLPSASRPVLCAASASVFLVTVANGIAFLAGNRLWWLWNPWNASAGPLTALGALLTLGVVAFGLAFVFPPDTRLKTSTRTTSLLPLAATNVLFFLATFLFALRGS